MPVTTRGTRHAYAARTLCARIIGNRSPKATTIFASTPVSSAGSTTCTGTTAWPVRVHLRQRFADRRRDGVRRGQLSEGGQQDAGRAEPVDGPQVAVAVDDVVLETEGGHLRTP